MIRTKTATYPIAQAWAAAAAADRINGGDYIKLSTYKAPGDTRLANSEAARKCLENPDTLLAEDYAAGQLLADHFSGLLFKALSGPIQSEFLAKVATIVAKSEVTAQDVAVMCSLANVYRKDLDRQKKFDHQASLAAKSEYLGAVGTRHTIQVTVLDKGYSQKYFSNIITVQANDSVLKFFTSLDSEKFPMNQQITIRGSIKRTAVNDRTGVKETWLNRVKVIA